MRYKKTSVLLSVPFLLVIWFVYGSIDASNFDDQGLLQTLVPVPDRDNGYQEIAYTQKQGFQLFDSSTFSKVMRHTWQQEWDDNFVRTLLQNHENTMAKAIATTKFKSFKFSGYSSLKDIPSYQAVVSMARLLILQSMSYAKAGRKDRAMDYFESAVFFSEKIKTESNHVLLSYMVGLAMQSEALLWLHHMTTDNSLRRNHFIKLLTVLDRIPQYKQDSFAAVFSGELAISKMVFNEYTQQSFFQRWTQYKEGSIWLLDEKHKTKRDIAGLLHVFFPDYAYQKNRSLTLMAVNNKKMAEHSHLYCRYIDTNSQEPTWIDALRPNAMAYLDRPSVDIYQSYFLRRCFAHAYVAGLKAIVAARLYRLDKHQWPPHFEALVPEYLNSLPIDPFDGSVLKYSKENQWFYSVGKNFLDDGGSSRAYYIKSCELNDVCARNPTFPLVFAPVKRYSD